MTDFKPVRLIDLTKPEIDYLFEQLTSIPQKPLINLVETEYDIANMEPEGNA